MRREGCAAASAGWGRLPKILVPAAAGPLGAAAFACRGKGDPNIRVPCRGAPVVPWRSEPDAPNMRVPARAADVGAPVESVDAGACFDAGPGSTSEPNICVSARFGGLGLPATGDRATDGAPFVVGLGLASARAAATDGGALNCAGSGAGLAVKTWPHLVHWTGAPEGGISRSSSS